MIILRYVLIALSALYAFSLMLAWAFSSKSGGIGSLITLILVSANVFYLIMSWPSVRTSDLLVKTSEKFASASLQLQHLAQEAHTREIEAEKRRIEDAELNEYKLQAAREMLQHFRPKLSLEQLSEAKPQLISYLTNTARSAVASLSPDPVVPAPFAPPAADKALPTNGHVLTPKPVPPAPVSSAPVTPVQATPAPVAPAPLAMPKAAPSARSELSPA
jgi:hypothetical protein